MKRSPTTIFCLLVPLAACSPGEEGMKGPTGEPGEQGPTGEVGPQGPVGPQGAEGPAGPAGIAGPVGQPGPQGPVGAIGPAGAVGGQGPRGFTGPTGPIGMQGIQGPVGPVGPAGPAGPAGDDGPAGPQGPEGAPGLTAAAAYGARAWDNGWDIPCCGWRDIADSEIQMNTSGGPLLITTAITLNGGSHGTCRPIVDGQWAATFAGEQDPGSPYWQEGILAVGCCTGGWRRWDKVRIYTGIPAGFHTFRVQCATDGGNMSTGPGQSFSVVELNAPPA